MTDLPVPIIYQFRIVLLGISPLIWRRILVRSDHTLADFHYFLQIAFGWSDTHLHRFLIHGKEWGIHQPGGISFRNDPYQVPLAQFALRPHEKFQYEYDFNDHWQHLIRVEALLPIEPTQAYPVCRAGRRAAPPEECGGA